MIIAIPLTRVRLLTQAAGHAFPYDDRCLDDAQADKHWQHRIRLVRLQMLYMNTIVSNEAVTVRSRNRSERDVYRLLRDCRKLGG